MRCDNSNQNLYSISNHYHRDQQFLHNHYHHESLTLSASETFQGEIVVSAFDQISNHQTASNSLNLHPQRISRNEGDLVAKLYYAKKKLVWEFLDGPLKSKIEIQWSEISAIRAFMYEAQPGLLEIELNQQPQFGREINPQPRKHTQWKQTTDFTQAQASICRRHSIIFPPGVLDKQYEKLLQCDHRLFGLSQQPFPINNYPFFYHHSNSCLDYSYTNVHHPPPTHLLGSNLPMPVMRFPYSDEGATRHPNENYEIGNSQSERIPAIPNGVQNHLLPYNRHELWTPVQQPQMKTLSREINSIEYVNRGISSIDQININHGTAIHEPTSWTSVSDMYGFPWEPITEDLRGLHGNQHNNHN
ncbi:hypothetical protein Ccrd_022275 [Cynara cardunculus var. scolymus]|uniref:TRF2/HOY1 PH-like domain-containing protein n=1 Tax=Cynara cardunculus var. scolymus TaxID=59895 RepID=A0A124SEA9_CYNCS|nr:hypothetical protein Ccrd_022275 [Cynara cardunculus var. scolymus]